MKICYTLLFLVFFQQAFSQDQQTSSTKPQQQQQQEDPELKDLQWNRYVKGEYVVLSIDENQGRWLVNNLDQVSKWCTSRWGLEDVTLNKECRIFCVPNNLLLKKLFNINESKAEVRRSSDGSVDINVIWLSLDSLKKEFVSPYLTHVLFSQQQRPFWFLKGTESINSSFESIRSKLEDKNLGYSCEKLFSLTQESYRALSKEEKSSFDTQCILLCLMLRKELGQVKLLTFLKEPDLSSGLRRVYGYKDVQDFESKYKMYCNDLLGKIDDVPDYYFNVKGVD